MAFIVEVGGIVRRMVRSSFRLSMSENGRDTAKLTLFEPDNDNQVDYDDEVIIEEDGDVLIAGTVQDFDESSVIENDSTPATHISIDVASSKAFAERRYVSVSLPTGVLSTMLQTLVAFIADPPYNVTLHPSQTAGPTIAAQTYNFKKLSEIFDELAILAGGYRWTIDADDYLLFYLPDFNTVTAPFAITDTTKNAEGKIHVSYRKGDYANRIWVRAGANAKTETENTESAVTPAGTVVGDYRHYPLAYPAISYLEKPKVILVNGVSFQIGDPGSNDEWVIQWVTSGPVETMTPILRHNDADFGATPGGVTLQLVSKNAPFYNIVADRWNGSDYISTSDGFRWYNGRSVAARDPKPIPHTVYENSTPKPIGIFGTTNVETGQPWDWVRNGELLGHRAALTALTSSDLVTIYSKAQFKLLIQSPLAASEPTAEQSTYGLHEAVYDAPDIFDNQSGQELADALYAKSITRTKLVQYRTRRKGIVPGMIQNIVVPERGLNGSFVLSEIEVTMDEGGVIRNVKAADGLFLQGSWKDTIRKWGATASGSGSSSSGTVEGGGGGSGGISRPTVYWLTATGNVAMQSPTPTWVEASDVIVGLNTDVLGTVNAVVFVRLKAAAGTVQARLRNINDGVDVGYSPVISATTFTLASFAVTLTAGNKLYQLELLPSLADTDVAAVGYLETI